MFRGWRSWGDDDGCAVRGRPARDPGRGGDPDYVVRPRRRTLAFTDHGGHRDDRRAPRGSGANGVVVAKNVNKLFAGLNDSNVAIIDLTSLTLIAKVNTGGKGRADELDYDPKDNKIYVANSGDGFVTVIDATTNAIVHKFDNLGAALEQPQYDSADGLMYMTSSDQNAVFVFDPAKDVLVRKDVLAILCSPQGIAINPKTNQALLGCNVGRAGSTGTSLTVAWDLAKRIFVGVFGQVGSGDSVTYSAKTDRFYFGAHNFPHGSSIGIFSGSPIR